MRILHTSDWHLGQKFLSRDRVDEHRAALDWLCDTIVQQKVDVLVVAGDIFDIGSPPNVARRLYYSFLTRLIPTSCRHVVIIGGNHDSPSMLEAPRTLLESLDTYVLGAAPETAEEAILQLRNQKGEVELIIGAVPFLRDRDLRSSQSGESGAERIEVIKTRIREHYDQIAEAIRKVPEHTAVPVLTTGHLYALGAQTDEKQDNIYIGDKENIRASDFSDLFDYVALGHIHRPQPVGDMAHVRYSGSLIPLSFSETKDQKSVYLLTFIGKKLKALDALEVPTFRRLKTIRGSMAEVTEKMRAFAARQSQGHTPWVEVLIETDRQVPNAAMELQELGQDLGIEVLKVRVLAENRNPLDSEYTDTELKDLDVLEVFQKKCLRFGTAPDQMEELEKTFRELLDWQRETKQENT